MALEPTELGIVIDQARNAFLIAGYKKSIEIDPMPDLPRVGADRQRIVEGSVPRAMPFHTLVCPAGTGAATNGASK